MKKVLFSLVLAIVLMTTLIVTLLAHAATIGYANNEIGGRIELTDVVVPAAFSDIAGCTNAHVARIWGNGIDDTYGCWIANVEDRTVTIAYPFGHRIYPLDAFRLPPNAPAKAPARKEQPAHSQNLPKPPEDRCNAQTWTCQTPSGGHKPFGPWKE